MGYQDDLKTDIDGKHYSKPSLRILIRGFNTAVEPFNQRHAEMIASSNHRMAVEKKSREQVNGLYKARNLQNGKWEPIPSFGFMEFVSYDSLLVLSSQLYTAKQFCSKYIGILLKLSTNKI